MPSHRPSIPKALVLLSLLHLASAQTQIGLGPCSTTCFSNAATAVKCPSYTDVSCICMSGSFIQSVSNCVQQTCPVAEMEASLQYLSKECTDWADQQAGITDVNTFTTPGQTFTTPNPYTTPAPYSSSATTTDRALKATTTATAAASAKAASKAYNIGRVIGAVCVVVALIVIAAIIGFVLHRRKKRMQRQSVDLLYDPQRGYKFDEPDYPKYQQGYPPTAPWEQQQPPQPQQDYRNVPVQQSPAPYSNPFASTATLDPATAYSQSVQSHGMEASPITPYAPSASSSNSYPRDVKMPMPVSAPSPAPSSSAGPSSSQPVASSSSSALPPGATSNQMLNFASQIQLSPAQLAVIERLVAQNLPPQQISAVIEGMMASAASGSSSSAQSSGSQGRRVVMNDNEASVVGDPAERKRREAERERNARLQEEEGTNDPPPMYNDA